MDRKHTDLTSSLLKLQALRDKVRLTEEAQLRQEKLRKEYEEKTEKLIAENDKISAKLIAKQKTAGKYKDLVENLIRQKKELEKKLQMLQTRVLAVQQENQKNQCESVAGPILTNKIVEPVAGPILTNKIVEPVAGPILTNKIIEPVAGPISTNKIVEPKTEPVEVKYDGANEDIWELKRSIAEIQSQLEAIEKNKEADE